MANEERGEVELLSGERSYTLVLSMNAICEMQTRTGKTYGQLLVSMRALDIVALRDIVWMTLKKYHAKDFPNAESVGNLIDALPGGANTAVATLTRLFSLNEEQARAGKAPPADPPNAQV